MRRLLVLAIVVGVLAAMAVAAGAAPLPKVDVCHFDAESGTFDMINISENAYEAHVAHGDARPGEGVPGLPGYGFDENCVPTALVTICQQAAGGAYVAVSVLPSEAVGQPKPGDPVPGMSGYRFADDSCDVLVWSLLETVQVPGYQAGPREPVTVVPVHSTTVLAAGEGYELRASGTYTFAGWGVYGIADAHCNYRSALYGGPGWTHSAQYYLEVWVNGAMFDWGPDNCPTLTTSNINHDYSGTITGAGTTINFQIMDSCSGSTPGCYTDNSGYIPVEIWGWVPA